MTAPGDGEDRRPDTAGDPQPTTDPLGTYRLHDAKRRDDKIVALVGGKVYRDLPTDLYVPPDALEVFLEAFEGPMDLLLYLIRRQNIDILDIRVSEITEQYMRHIDLMKVLKLELAGEYLVMAATLAEIKSRMLLSQPGDEDEDEEDPRETLIRRLRDYERLKEAAGRLDELPRLERDLHTAHAVKPDPVKRHAHPAVDLKEVLVALADVLKRAELHKRHTVAREGLSVRERMTDVLARVNGQPDLVPFDALFDLKEGRSGIVVTFLALMELLRDALIDLVQSAPFAPIYVRAPQADPTAHLAETGAESGEDV
ncbi:MAG: segregation/condensation protein A [Gammaproteobacteria bacterium]|nr:segregation/condensation protein A [Gammaproteobacteria bacterium]MYF31336.1 segregation/condensation protein A [Gammaproteobacteria bacterium]MYK45775.1 segregation/condensation protein A [Gammaproteobacteria bacterium]